MKTEFLQMLDIHKLSEHKYNEELSSDRIDESAIYLTPSKPYIGKNGNWWQNNTDTRVKAIPDVVNTKGESTTSVMSQDAVTKELNKKLDVVTTGQGNRLYGININNKQSIFQVSENVYPWAIALRDANGRLKIAEGIYADHAVTKGYVDQMDIQIDQRISTLERTIEQLLSNFSGVFMPINLTTGRLTYVQGGATQVKLSGTTRGYMSGGEINFVFVNENNEIIYNYLLIVGNDSESFDIDRAFDIVPYAVKCGLGSFCSVGDSYAEDNAISCDLTLEFSTPDDESVSGT